MVFSYALECVWGIDAFGVWRLSDSLAGGAAALHCRRFRYCGCWKTYISEVSGQREVGGSDREVFLLYNTKNLL